MTPQRLVKWAILATGLFQVQGASACSIAVSQPIEMARDGGADDSVVPTLTDVTVFMLTRGVALRCVDGLWTGSSCDGSGRLVLVVDGSDDRTPGDRLGYRVEVVKQIHEKDCYSRLGRAGGIRAVLPLHDTATYSTMVTLVNFNSSVTTTSNSVDFYDRKLAEFKTQLMSRTGNAP